MTKPLSAERLKELRDLCDKATPGPWRHIGGGKGWTLFENGSKWRSNNDNDLIDAAFIAAAREALPALLEEVARLQQTVGYLRTKQLGFYDGTALGEVAAERDRLRKELDKDPGFTQAEKDRDILKEENERLRSEVSLWASGAAVLVPCAELKKLQAERDALKAENERLKAEVVRAAATYLTDRKLREGR